LAKPGPMSLATWAGVTSLSYSLVDPSGSVIVTIVVASVMEGV